MNWVTEKWRDSENRRWHSALLSQFTDLSTTPSFSEFLRLTGPIPCSHCSLQPWGKQVNWSFSLIINEEFFQGASSFLLLSSDLFHRLLKSASKLGGKVDKRTDRSYSYVVRLEGVFHLQSTLTINYRIHFYSSHFHRTSTSEFPSRGEYVTLKKKRCNRMMNDVFPSIWRGREWDPQEISVYWSEVKLGIHLPHWKQLRGYCHKDSEGGLSPPSNTKNHTAPKRINKVFIQVGVT